MELFKMTGKNGMDYTEYLDKEWDIDYYKIKIHKHTNPQSLYDMTMHYIDKWYNLKELSITRKQKTICNSMLHFVANNYNKKLKYFQIKVLTKYTINDKIYSEVKERKLTNMRYVTNYELKDIEVLRDLLNDGYVGITETGIAVKELTDDDKAIETLINELEA